MYVKVCVTVYQHTCVCAHITCQEILYVAVHIFRNIKSLLKCIDQMHFQSTWYGTWWAKYIFKLTV